MEKNILILIALGISILIASALSGLTGYLILALGKVVEETNELTEVQTN